MMYDSAGISMEILLPWSLDGLALIDVKKVWYAYHNNIIYCEVLLLKFEFMCECLEPQRIYLWAYSGTAVSYVM
jgi:hypothetical protein